MYKHKRKASWVSRMLAMMMAVVLVFSVLPCGVLAAEISSESSMEVYESVAADDSADYSTDPWDGDGSITIPVVNEDGSNGNSQKCLRKSSSKF